MSSDDSDDEMNNILARTKTASSAPQKKPVDITKVLCGKRGSVNLEALLNANKQRTERIDNSNRELELAAERREAERRAELVETGAPCSEEEEATGSSSAAPMTSAEASSSSACVFSLIPRIPALTSLAPVAGTDDPMRTVLVDHSPDHPTVVQLLQGGWLMAHYCRRPPDHAILRWLLEVACYQPDTSIATAARDALTPLLLPEKAPVWVPAPVDVLDVLGHYGADLSILSPTGKATADESAGASDGNGEQVAMGEMDAALDLRHNLLGLLEVVSVCARNWRCHLRDDNGLVDTLHWLLLLQLEPHAAPGFLHLQDAVSTLLETFSVGEWEAGCTAWATQLVSRLCRGNEGMGRAGDEPGAAGGGGAAPSRAAPKLAHTALVQVCQWLPPTARGGALQVRAALATIRLLVDRRQQGEGVDTDGEGGGDPPPQVVAALVALLREVDMAKWSTQMATLHSVLLLSDLALSSSAAALSGEQPALSELKTVLNVMKQRVLKHGRTLDYHALECGNMLSFMCSKVAAFFLSG